MSALTLRRAMQRLASRHPDYLFDLRWSGRGGLLSRYIVTARAQVGADALVTPAHSDPLDALRDMLAELDTRKAQAMAESA